MMKEFKVGDRVKITGAYNPKLTGKLGTVRIAGDYDCGVEMDEFFGGHSCDGSIKEGHGWWVDNGQMEKIGFIVGDRVRLNIPCGSAPVCGWGKVHNGEEGIVTAVNGENITVDFPAQSGWCGVCSEFELIEPAKKVPPALGKVFIGTADATKNYNITVEGWMGVCTEDNSLTMFTLRGKGGNFTVSKEHFKPVEIGDVSDFEVLKEFIKVADIDRGVALDGLIDYLNEFGCIATHEIIKKMGVGEYFEG